MDGLELYHDVRLAVVEEGLSEREAARRFGIDRRTVKKMPRHSGPPGYQRSQPVRRPKLESFTGIIDAILAADRDVPRKQRHTVQRIFERLRDEYGFSGGYGRDPLAPFKDALTADGNVVVPIDAEAFGFWLKAAFGQPISTGTFAPYTHESGRETGRCPRCPSRPHAQGAAGAVATINAGAVCTASGSNGDR